MQPALGNMANNSDFTMLRVVREAQGAVVREVQRNAGDFKRHLRAEL